MNPRLLLIYLTIVLIPAGLIAWLGWRVSQEEQHRVQRELTSLMMESLQTTRGSIDQLLSDRSSEVYSLLEQLTDSSPPQWRSIGRTNPWVRQILVLDADSQLQFPDPNNRDNLTDRERSFLTRTESIWHSGASFGKEDDFGRTQNRGWYTWYWNNGLHLMAWQKDPKSGKIVAAEIERMRLVAEVLAKLPSEGIVGVSIPDQAQIQLKDISDQLLYSWGRYQPNKDSTPNTSLKLTEPLQAWTLEYYSNLATTQQRSSRRTLVNTFALLTMMMLASAGLAFYFYRETSRKITEASQRVTFVNQVSHELKSPLTNIRLYAEMLENKLDSSDIEPRKSLDVIVSESQRLSRLITNVLSFSQSQQDKLSVNMQTGVIDDTISSTLDHFRPVLEQEADFQIELDLSAKQPAQFDPDAIEQILTNLLSNIEKYAKHGQWLRIESSLQGDDCVVTVADRGNGIPESKQNRIFEPFERLSDKLSDAAGTGIGLTIARSLAQLHGGDLTCASTPDGATFRLQFNVHTL